MSKVSKEIRMGALRSEIINRVKAIQSQKDEKKTMQMRFNTVIKNLESEKDRLLEELDETQRMELTEAADDLLAKHGSPELAKTV